MKKFTDITVLLDRSGSMWSVKQDMEGGFNKFIEEHKAVPTSKVTLVQFDSINPHEVVYQSVPVRSVEPLKLSPRGGTPLIDAMVHLIDNTGRRYAGLPESERPDQVLFVIITDGGENSSKEFKRHDVFNRVSKQTNDYKWQFVYLGANQDAIGEATSYGMNANLAINFSTLNKTAMRDAWAASSHNTVSYASNSDQLRGRSTQLQWTDDQRTKSMGSETKTKGDKK